MAQQNPSGRCELADNRAGAHDRTHRSFTRQPLLILSLTGVALWLLWQSLPLQEESGASTRPAGPGTIVPVEAVVTGAAMPAADPVIEPSPMSAGPDTGLYSRPARSPPVAAGIGSASDDLADGGAASVVNVPLKLAVINGEFDAVALMLANGSDVNTRSGAGAYPGETPLHAVAYAGHTRIAELLLAYGADINAADQYRYTPLRRTVEQGHLEMTELLIDKGADIVTRDINGLNLLHVVARTDHVEIARLLITGGVDINAMDGSGFTPLDYAQGGELRMARTLERYGATCTVC